MLINTEKKIVGDEVIETVIQMVCDNCKKIQVHCKCLQPNYNPVTSIYRRPVVFGDVEGEIKEGMSKAESLAIYKAKKAKFDAKFEEQTEVKRISVMDEDDYQKEVEAKEKQSRETDIMAARNKEALSNVDEIRSLRQSLAQEGKTTVEIKSAVKDLQVKQSAKRGRPANNAVISPIKNPQTGEFISSEE